MVRCFIMSLVLNNAFLLTATGSLQYYTSDDLTPAEFQALVSNEDLSSQLVLSLSDTETTENFYIDYSHLITDQGDAAAAETWAALLEILENNDLYRMGYTWEHMNPSSSLPYSDVYIWDVMHTLNTFDLNYADHVTGEYGSYIRRYAQRDLRIAIQDGASEYPDLTQCVPIVNGFVCQPYMHNHSNTVAMYAKGGAQLCWQEGIHRTPEIVLLDFSDFGGIETHHFLFSTEVTERTDGCIVRSAEGDWTLDARWLFKTNLSMREYTPIPVILGVPVWPDKVTIESDCTFSIQPNLIPLNYAMALRKYLEDKWLGAGNAYPTQAFQHMYEKGEFTALSFIIYVKSPRVFVVRQLLDIWGNYLTVHLHTPDGILISDRTDTISPYYKATYTDRVELTIQNQESMHVSDNNYTDHQLLYIPPDCRHNNLVNLKESRCSMIYLIRGIYD